LLRRLPIPRIQKTVKAILIRIKTTTPDGGNDVPFDKLYAEVKDIYQRNSYGLTNIDITNVAEEFEYNNVSPKMGDPAEPWDNVTAFIKKKAAEKGINLKQYNLLIQVVRGLKMGLGGGDSIFVPPSFSAQGVAHEIGHTLGFDDAA
jgi:hypothetical protein